MIRKSVILTFIVALCCSSLLCSRAFGENSWTFVMMGDTRGEDNTTTGVSQYLPAIANKIAFLNPNQVLINGDLVNGDALDNTPDVNNPRIPYATQFTNWKAAMKPVYDAGIAIYPDRGNHENYADDVNPPIVSLKAAYYNAFGSTVPQNGPNNGSNDNQVGYSWDLKVKNVRIVAVDQYFYYQATPLGGRNYYQIDQSWLNAQLSKTAPRRYTFVMAHEPVYSLSHAEGGFYGTSAQGIADRDAFWNSLGANGVKMYLTSHVHNVQVGTAVDTSGNVIYQNMEGDGGAKLDPDDSGQDPLLTPTYSNFKDYGFSLYTVTDNSITVKYYLYDPATLTWSVAPYTITLLANPAYTWNTPSGTFSDAASWDPGTVPGAADTAVFDSGPAITSTVNFTGDVTNNKLFVASGATTFNLNGHTYTVLTSMAIDGTEDATYQPYLTITGNGSKLVAGALTMDAGATLSVGQGTSVQCTTLTVDGNSTITGNGSTVVTGTLTMDAGATFSVGQGTSVQCATMTAVGNSTLVTQAGSVTSYGKITSTGAATIPASTSVIIDVNGYIPSGSQFTVVDTGRHGVSAVPATLTASSPVFAISGSNASGDLVLTATRANSYQSFSSNANASQVGSVLNTIASNGTATEDMVTVLSALDSLRSASQINSALESMLPNADNSSPRTSYETMFQFINNILSRFDNVAQVQTRGADNAVTGASLDTTGIWAQGFDTYLHQGPRDTSNGYNANVWGTSVGFDTPLLTDSIVGLSGGYARGGVRTKDSSARSDIDSYAGSIYGSYAKDDYYVDLIASFAYNVYDSSRHVAFGAIDRTPTADYGGQQYSGYIESGYTFKNKNVTLTPLASLQYSHLHINNYTEENGGSVNLSVAGQDYDVVQSGLGAKLAYKMLCKDYIIIPDLHFKWFYDFIGDRQQSTSTFTGGGASFVTNGFDPAQSSYSFGTKLILMTTKNVTLTANYDFESKEDFYSHAGYLNLRYDF